MPYPFHLLENQKLPVPAQDIETFIRHILGQRSMRVERRNLYETDRSFRLDFYRRHLGLDRYMEDKKPAYIYFGGAEIIGYSNSTEIIKIWAATPEDWYVQMFSLNIDKVMEERFGLLEELSNEIKQRFAQPGSDKPSEGLDEAANMDELTIYLNKTDKTQFCKWLSIYCKNQQVENKSYRYLDGQTYNFYFPFDISPDFQSQVVISANFTKIVEANEAEEKYTMNWWDIEKALKVSWLEIGERMKITISHYIGGWTVPPLFDMLEAFGKDWPETQPDIWRHVQRQAEKYHKEKPVISWAANLENHITQEQLRKYVLPNEGVSQMGNEKFTNSTGRIHDPFDGLNSTGKLAFDIGKRAIEKSEEDAAEVNVSKLEGKILPRIPKQFKKLNDWKVAWRKVKGKWRGGSNYQELARLANVSPETIADIVKAGDARLLD